MCGGDSNGHRPKEEWDSFWKEVNHGTQVAFQGNKVRELRQTLGFCPFFLRKSPGK